MIRIVFKQEHAKYFKYMWSMAEIFRYTEIPMNILTLKHTSFRYKIMLHLKHTDTHAYTHAHTKSIHGSLFEKIQ